MSPRRASDGGDEVTLAAAAPVARSAGGRRGARGAPPPRAAPAAETRAGEPALGRYVLGRPLGAGGFGTVYEAEDLRLGRMVAVKVIEGAGSPRERFRREALAAARLDHPGIVAVFDAGERGGTRYLVSELVRGTTLAELEAAGELSDRDVVRVGLALADALSHAHRRGVVHRDVKPQNVMIPAEDPHAGDDWRAAAKLADFGVAALADDDSLTQTGDIVGTLAYMAPEQAAGERVDERADVYALALLLYEGFAGINPVRAGSPAATARRVGTVLPSLARHRRDLPAELCDAIDAGLDPEPDRRASLGELSDALAEALPEVSDEDGAIEGHPLEGGMPRLPALFERVAAGLGAGALVAIALSQSELALPVPAAWSAVSVGALVLAAPRAGWLAGALLVLAALAVGEPARPGIAALALLLVVATPLLLGGRGTVWSLPALAPALGLAASATAFPAIAGRAGRWPLRAGLGALGALWLLLGDPLTERTLLFGAPAATPPPGALAGDAETAVREVIGPLVESGAVALIALWSAAAVSLPWLVRGRSTGLDVAAAILWAGGVAAATVALAGWLGAAGDGGSPRDIAIGALVAVAVAVWRRS